MGSISDPWDGFEPSPEGDTGEYLDLTFPSSLADVEYFDEPSPDDAAELDGQVWAHIDSLLVGYSGDEDDDDDDDDEDRIAEADRLEDARIGDDDDDDDNEPGDGSDVEDSMTPPNARRCRVCGCTDGDCRRCIERTGVPCYWVEADLCSACMATPTGRTEMPTGPLADTLAQIFFDFGAERRRKTAAARRDPTTSGDAPGWKGAGDA